MNKKKYRRGESLSKTLKAISEIKDRVPKIIFRAQNLVVTLRSKSQLKRWIDLYPKGTYTINY
ncbi:MAG: hypothetical protein CMD28_05785 [Flavobacteriales bacterium]|jgi:hypothetical protein|nr:hypothetical protein [Flavobacteriales bacterium]